MALQIIGAGFGRTGTLTLKTALEDLGFGRCYHMLELFENRTHITHWESALQQKNTDWTKLFEGYQAAVDFPACYYYKELMDYFPEAKVILTERDPEQWYNSAISTILNYKPTVFQIIKLLLKAPFSSESRNFIRIGKHNDTLLHQKLFSDKKNKNKTIDVYLQHNEAVKKNVPADRLLVYEVTQGWEPLCNFLEVPVPSKEFPKTNRKEDFGNLVKRVKI